MTSKTARLVLHTAHRHFRSRRRLADDVISVSGESGNAFICRVAASGVTTLVVLAIVRRCKRKYRVRMRSGRFVSLVATMQLEHVERVVVLIATRDADHAHVWLALLLMMMRLMMMMMMTMTTGFFDVIVLVADAEFVVGRQVLLAEVVRVSVSC